MPTQLSEPIEEKVRQYFVDNIRTGEIEGYDPTQTDESASDFLPITADWSMRGDYYPIISVRETDGPTIPNSGNTNFNGMQGDGSGPNQYYIQPVTVSAQAVQVPSGGGYRNSTDAKKIVRELYDEAHHQIQTNIGAIDSEIEFAGMTPPTTTRSTEETDSGNTITRIQKQGVCNVGVIDEP